MTSDPESRPLLQRTSSQRRALKYPNQLLAFYLYSISSGIYSTVALVLFLPVLLEDIARQNGKLKTDHAVSCSYATSDTPCAVNFLGSWIDTASFSLFVSGISLAAQVVVLVSIGDFADHISSRSRLILTSSLAGSISGILFFAINPESPGWWIIAFLALLGNVAFGVTLVCLNASLSDVTRISRPVILVETELDAADDKSKADVLKKYNKTVAKQTATISAQGSVPLISVCDNVTLKALLAAFAFGNAAGLAILGFCYIPIKRTGENSASLKIAVGIAGICWLVFAGVATYFNRRNFSSQGESYYRFSLLEGWHGLLNILRDAAKLEQNFKFLIAWFILSDGFSAVTTAALLYAKTSIGMQPSQITLIGIISPLCGITANLILPRLAARYNIASLTMLNGICCAAVLAPLYVILSYIPFFRHEGSFGSFSTPTEIFVFVAYFGVIAGAFESYARAIYSELIPKRQETRFFSLFSITNKGSAFLGPSLVALCNQLTGSLRSAFIFLLITLLLPLPILFNMNMEKGRSDAEAFAYKSRRNRKGDE